LAQDFYEYAVQDLLKEKNVIIIDDINYNLEDKI
jgi:adenine/guanine phosphoribosyltransferase-like PRPP-binding protein